MLFLFVFALPQSVSSQEIIAVHVVGHRVQKGSYDLVDNKGAFYHMLFHLLLERDADMKERIHLIRFWCKKE